ncbi:MAG: prolyl oligopeptidase family serine peptidase [Planctomycetes bacterium]|nr:prolyl oligopeptidase family serine peptidase [Planctomycetota bacterium]
MNRRDLLRASALGAVGITGGGPSLRAAEASPADEMIHKYLAAETKRISAKFLDGATTKEGWEQVRPRLKREFLYMLGLDPLPEKTPLKATVTGTLEAGAVTVEKLHYQSRPGLYVTANLYRPKAIAKDAKLPAVLYVCGHSNRGRDGNKTAFQDHGLWFAANGYVCLVVDTLQLGEIAGKHHGTYNLNRFWWHARGYTPAGVECWNGIRGIDYLTSLPFVDAEKIGVTGISGGGASTNWICAADDRVKVAVPVSGVSDLECYVTDRVINGHCDCMFFHNLYQWEWTTALALFAPKPLLFANSDKDPIFPMSGNKRIIERLRKCYDLFGAKEKVDEHVSPGGHDYRPDLRLAIFGFFHAHLKGDNTPVKDADFPKIEGKDLRAFPEDGDIPKDAINATADESFVPVAKVELPTEKKFKGWKAEMLKQLREKVFRALPEKIAPVERGHEIKAKWFTASSEKGIDFITVEDMNAGGEVRATLMVLNPDESLDKVPKLLKALPPSKDLFTYVMSPRGGLHSHWTRKNPPNTVERSLALLGQTVDAGRVRDVAGVYASMREPHVKAPFRAGGNGQAGIIAAYAALFVPGGVDEVVIIDPPVSHRDGPHFLNVMRVLDIPEALGLLAPNVRLTLVGKSAKDKAFDRTEAIYKAAGAADKFKRE